MRRPWGLWASCLTLPRVGSASGRLVYVTMSGAAATSVGIALMVDITVMTCASIIKVGDGLSLDPEVRRRQKADRDRYSRLPAVLNDPTFLVGSFSTA